MSSLFIRNRQRAVSVDVRYLRRLTRALLQTALPDAAFDLGIYLVRAPEMARLNETHLQHEGSTDVITFDYAEPKGKVSGVLHGEIFVCIDEALAQAPRFRTTWQSELVRYVIHGILHLRGFGDVRPADRRKMKREESRWLKEIGRSFPLRKLSGGPKLAA